MNLYHYASNQALLSIVETGELRASDLSLSNDSMEGRWLRQVCEVWCKDNKVEKDHVAQLLEHVDNMQRFLGCVGFCMSKEADLLSQWRAYADNGAGTSIGFSRDYLEKLCKETQAKDLSPKLMLADVEYDKAKQKAGVDELLKNLIAHAKEVEADNREMLKAALMGKKMEIKKKMTLEPIRFIPLMYTYKNPAFKEEQECRLISYTAPTLAAKAKKNDSHMEYRTALDRIVPYEKVKLANGAISEIVLGPRNITPPYVIQGLLAKHGFEGVELRYSSASYR